MIGPHFIKGCFNTTLLQDFFWIVNKLLLIGDVVLANECGCNMMENPKHFT